MATLTFWSKAYVIRQSAHDGRMRGKNNHIKFRIAITRAPSECHSDDFTNGVKVIVVIQFFPPSHSIGNNFICDNICTHDRSTIARGKQEDSIIARDVILENGTKSLDLLITTMSQARPGVVTMPKGNDLFWTPWNRRLPLPAHCFDRFFGNSTGRDRIDRSKDSS